MLSPAACFNKLHNTGSNLWQMIQTGTYAANVLFQKNFDQIWNTMFSRLDFERMWFHLQNCFTVHYFKKSSVYQQYVALLFQRHEESSELWLSQQVESTCACAPLHWVDVTSISVSFKWTTLPISNLSLRISIKYSFTSRDATTVWCV